MPETFLHVVFNLPLNQEFVYSLPQEFPLPSLGVRVKAPFGRSLKEGLLVDITKEPCLRNFEVKPIEKVLDQESLFGEWTLTLARWIAKQYFCSLGEALFTMLPQARKERALPFSQSNEETSDHELALSDEQKKAVEDLVLNNDPLTYLLGVTGSGKTEVFLQAAQRILDRGQQVIYLVPEIALTWQLMEILQKRFHSRVAVLHSGLTASQKLKEWRRLQKGEADFVVGARSAIFAPIKNPGLLILDEEHESSYKSGSAPRYHARQVALFWAKKTGAKVVLGSATPSLEAVHLIRQGQLKALRLTRRISGGQPPHIRVISLQGQKTILSPVLIESIHQTHQNKRQTILFLNRRGFLSAFQCRTCGGVLVCKDCSVSLTWHKKRGILLCHYCGWQTSLVHTCPECDSLDVGWNTMGIELAEAEIRRTFPDLRIERLDSDVAAVRGYAERILEEFRQGQIDVLLGTQMVAKGLNFPLLQLVGILQADQGLSLPDFRAAERVFALIRQVSGRAGRYHPDGQVVLQTFRPQAWPIVLASQGKEEDFWSQELANRELLDFPPFCRLIRLIFRGVNKDRAQKAAFCLMELLKTTFFAYPTVEIFGPTECALGLIAGNHRYQILLKSKNFSQIHEGLRRCLAVLKISQGIHLEIDVDPLQFI